MSYSGKMLYLLGISAVFIGLAFGANDAWALDDCGGLKYALNPQFRTVISCLEQITEQADLLRAQIMALESENRLHEALICSLALDERGRDPTSLGASIYEQDCPKPKTVKPKAASPK